MINFLDYLNNCVVWQIPMSSEGMQWYEYVNHDIKEQELEGGYLN